MYCTCVYKHHRHIDAFHIFFNVKEGAQPVIGQLTGKKRKNQPLKVQLWSHVSTQEHNWCPYPTLPPDE